MPRWNRALVTGASSGIGAALAHRLAADGTHLVTVARDGERLERLASELPVDVEVVAADLGEPDDLDRVVARLEDGDSPIDLLVNNAGFGHHGSFAALDPEAERRMIAVNVTALHRLCHGAARAMSPRGRGGILNVASVAGMMPSPGGATYNATKAFVVSLSESLHMELAPVGIHVSALCPGLTRTEFHDRAGIDMSGVPGWLWQDAGPVAAAGLDAVARGRARVVTGIPNRAVVAGLRLMPDGLGRRVIAAVSVDR